MEAKTETPTKEELKGRQDKLNDVTAQLQAGQNQDIQSAGTGTAAAMEKPAANAMERAHATANAPTDGTPYATSTGLQGATGAIGIEVRLRTLETEMNTLRQATTTLIGIQERTVQNTSMLRDDDNALGTIRDRVHKLEDFLKRMHGGAID
jgi:hypothetical protein